MDSIERTIDLLISKGETEDSEFKVEEVKAETIAKALCSFANKKGGYILFGIQDKTEDLIGIRNKNGLIEKIENANRNMVVPMVEIKCAATVYKSKLLVLLKVMEGTTLHQVKNSRQIYVRTGASNSPADQEAIIKILNDRRRFYFEDTPVDCTFESLDDERVQDYLSKVPTMPIFEDRNKLFSTMGLSNRERPTVAAVLIFHKDPQQFIPNGCLQVRIYDEDHPNREESDYREQVSIRNHFNIIGSLPCITTDCMDIIEKHAKDFSEVGEAIKEAIINAIVHRDYSFPSPVTIDIWPSRILIRNPGGLMAGMTVDDLISHPQCIQRNPKIARIMQVNGFGSGFCRGMYIIRDQTLETDTVSEAIINTDNFSFRVEFNLLKSDEYSDEEAHYEE